MLTNHTPTVTSPKLHWTTECYPLYYICLCREIFACSILQHDLSANAVFEGLRCKKGYWVVLCVLDDPSTFINRIVVKNPAICCPSIETVNESFSLTFLYKRNSIRTSVFVSIKESSTSLQIACSVAWCICFFIKNPLSETVH